MSYVARFNRYASGYAEDAVEVRNDDLEKLAEAIVEEVGDSDIYNLELSVPVDAPTLDTLKGMFALARTRSAEIEREYARRAYAKGLDPVRANVQAYLTHYEKECPFLRNAGRARLREDRITYIRKYFSYASHNVKDLAEAERDRLIAELEKGFREIDERMNREERDE